MDARRVLPFLLLVSYIINGTFANQNDWDRPNNIRRIRRISEYLVPPPPPRFHPLGRLPRLANTQPTSQPGYLEQLMNWLNPFSSNSSPQQPPSLPVPPQPAATEFIQSAPLPHVTDYNGPPPVDYEKPPLPPSSVNDHSGYPAPIKTKNCNSCNKVPWMPMQETYEPELPHLKDASHASSPLQSQGGEYLPRNPEVPHDAYHAASQEIRGPEFSFAPPLFNEQDGSFIDPHLFPGALPPLFKAVNFNYPVHVTPDENPGYLKPPPSSISGNGVPTGNGSFLNTAGPTFNNGHNGQSVYPGPSEYSGGRVVPQEPAYINPGASNEEFENYNQNNAAHGDLSSSGTQVSHGHASGISSNNEFYDITGSSGTGNFLNNANQINQNLPSSYGISGLDRIPNNYEQPYDDLSSSANVVEGSHAPLNGSSGNIGDSINFEESPLDFTHKDESRTHSSSIPSTSNAFAGFESTVITGTTVVPGDEIFGTRQEIAPTESYVSTDYFEIIDTVAKESKINSSTSQGTDRGPSRNHLLTDYVAEEILTDTNMNLDTTGQQGATRNRQVQVIIPYTSQYTPLPFHPSHERKADTSESNHDSYVGEESRSRIEVASPPNSTHLFQSLGLLRKIFEERERDTRKSVNTKANNSIEVHKLQKNIDNWTIQEYSRGTTVSTVSPSSDNPYLLPSKKIPNEYFMSTKPVDYVIDSHNDNSKTLLNGFSFNDEEYTDSGRNRMESSRVVKIESSSGSSTDASTTSRDMWQGFPVGISSVNKERVYVVTPQPSVTTSRSNFEYRQEKALKEAEKSKKESKKILQADTKKMKKSDAFESIEKAYQVLPQAVNNLAVASTGPESVPLWGIMEHEEFASPVDSEYDNNDTEFPTLHSRLSKESRARR